MATNQQTLCDCCSAVLYGNDKKQWNERPFINIRGRITLQNHKSAGGDKYHVFVTHKNQDDYSFCDNECLIDYITTRHDAYLKRQEALLREEAQEEYVSGSSRASRLGMTPMKAYESAE